VEAVMAVDRSRQTDEHRRDRSDMWKRWADKQKKK
jgi:hypothetical protein